jgi:hypothetical protein
MPGAIALIASFAATLGTGAVASTAIFYGVSAALYLGVSIGLQFLAQALLAPKAPKPEDVQSSFKQPMQPRARHYGRVKVSGPWVFAESQQGSFYKVLAIGQGPIDGIEQYWFDDHQIALNAGGWANWGDFKLINIQTRPGNPTETAYGNLTAVFPQWTAAHRGDGVASMCITQAPISSEFFLQAFPNGLESSYRLVIRGVRVRNPISGTTAWEENAAAIILDYMTHADGMRLPLAIFNTPLALASWQAAYNRCAELVPLAGGGVEARYRLWGSYYLNERPADVLGRMLQNCDARLWPTPDGGLALDIGQWAEPTVVLDADAIVGFSDLSRGKDILTTANTIRATYLGVDQDYQSADADPWVDAVDVSNRGEIVQEIDLIMSPTHSQARRLMKLASYRANPRWVGTFQCNLAGLAAIGERLVRIRYPLFELDEVFEVQDFRMIIGEGNILQGVTLTLLSMPDDAYQWDPAQEQGDAPISDDTDVDHTVPLPNNFAVQVLSRIVGGGTVFYAQLSWTAPTNPSLKVEAQGRHISAAEWIAIPVADGAITADSFALSDGEQYEFQIRNVTGGSRPGDWTPSIIVTAA